MTTVTSIGAYAPTSGDKITERVFLWFLVWLSQITQEGAKTTQAESQNLQGRPDPLVCLDKHLHVIPQAQGRLHPSSTGMGAWLSPGCDGDISGKVEAFQTSTESLCPSAGPMSARPLSAQEGPRFLSCSSGLCGEALASCLPGAKGRAVPLCRRLSHGLPLSSTHWMGLSWTCLHSPLRFGSSHGL